MLFSMTYFFDICAIAVSLLVALSVTYFCMLLLSLLPFLVLAQISSKSFFDFYLCE